MHACLAGSHYVDLANDVAAVAALLALNAGRRRGRRRTIVTGAGFGVTATESVVVKLTQRPGPATRASSTTPRP